VSSAGKILKFAMSVVLRKVYGADNSIFLQRRDEVCVGHCYPEFDLGLCFSSSYV